MLNRCGDSRRVVYPPKEARRLAYICPPAEKARMSCVISCNTLRELHIFSVSVWMLI